MPPKSFCQRASNFLLVVRESYKKAPFLSKTNPSNRTYGHKKCNFDTPAKNSFGRRPKGRKFFAQCVKVVKKQTFAKRCFPSKCSYGHVVCSFNNPVGKIPTKGRKVLLKRQKCWWKLTRFGKNINFRKKVLMTRRRLFWQTRLKNFPECRKFLSQFPKRIEKTVSFRNKFLKQVLWTSQIQFRQTWQKIFDNKQNLWAQNLKMIKYTLCSKTFFTVALEVRKIQFWQTRQNFWQWPENF